MMDTLELTAALILAVARNDVRSTPVLLDALEQRLPADELADLLEAIFDPEPAKPTKRPASPTLCA